MYLPTWTNVSGNTMPYLIILCSKSGPSSSDLTALETYSLFKEGGCQDHVILE